jgi:hypothetical protein
VSGSAERADVPEALVHVKAGSQQIPRQLFSTASANSGTA